MRTKLDSTLGTALKRILSATKTSPIRAPELLGEKVTSSLRIIEIAARASVYVDAVELIDGRRRHNSVEINYFPTDLHMVLKIITDTCFVISVWQTVPGLCL